MDKLELDKILNEMRELVERRVGEGFDDPEQIIASAVEVTEADIDAEELEAHAERLTTASIEEHRRQQRQWIGPTDCDRLDQAFEQLEQEGIVARQNFTCCQTCGHSEIWGEIAAVETEEERKMEGYTFYHMQDTEGACEGGFLYLAYAAVSDVREETTLIGQRIARALERAGLTVQWDGSSAQRIGVRLQWRRRR